MNSKNLMKFVLPIVLILLFLAVSYFYTFAQLSSKYSDIKKYDDETISAQSNLTALEKTKTLLDKSKSTLADAKVAVADDKDSPNIIAELERLAARYGAIIPSVQISDVATSASKSKSLASVGNGLITPVTVSFMISGSADNMKAFVETLENDLKIFNIKSMVVSSSTSGLTLSIQAEIYKSASTATK
ncbi:MAG: hypothetical protein WC227_02470 [Patescibacteria group bacterium]|jgi:hypothetical protein